MHIRNIDWRLIMQLEVGSAVGIPCEVQPGPFEDEMLVSIDHENGMISGFVKRENVRELKPGKRFVKAYIKDIEQNTIWLEIEGSFFTTNGLTSVSEKWASDKLGTILA